MKLSHFLIAALVSSSVMVNAQTGSKQKIKKEKVKTEKKQKEKLTVCADKTLTVDKANFRPKYTCPACGRG